MTEIVLREIRTPAEMNEAVELQKIYWGEDMGALVPAHMLLAIVNHGGHVPAAFDGDRMVGLLIGFLGADREAVTPEKPLSRCMLVMSKRMVVLPEYRSYNIGTRLKLAQRDFALQYQIPLVTWTFDPVLARNAYLNLHKLGAVGQKYAVSYFGSDSAYAMLSDDRLVVNWWVAHPHTVIHAEGRAPALSRATLMTGQALNETTLQDDLLRPDAINHPVGEPLLLEIPMDYPALERRDAGLARAWRDHLREAFTTAFDSGYLVTDFMREGDRTYYVFTRDDGTFDFA